MTSIIKTWTVVIAIALIALNRSIAGECDEVLRAAYKYLNYSSTSEFVSDLERILRMSNDEIRQASSQSSGGGSFNLIGVLELGGGGGSGDASLDIIRSRLRDDRSSHLSNEEVQNIALRIPDKDVIDAWKFCVGRDRLGLILTATEDAAGGIRVKAEWRPPFGCVPSAVTVESFVINDSIDTNCFKQGTTIQGLPSECTYRRRESGPIHIQIRLADGYGTYAEILPARYNLHGDWKLVLRQNTSPGTESKGTVNLFQHKSGAQGTVYLDNGQEFGVSGVLTDNEFTISFGPRLENKIGSGTLEVSDTQVSGTWTNTRDNASGTWVMTR